MTHAEDFSAIGARDLRARVQSSGIRLQLGASHVLVNVMEWADVITLWVCVIALLGGRATIARAHRLVHALTREGNLVGG